MVSAERSCRSCGAAIDLPEGPPDARIRCAYCGTSHARSDLLRTELAAAERLHEALGRKLDAHASSQRRVFALGAVGIVAVVLVALVAVRSGSGERAETSPARAASPPPEPAAAPSAEPAPPVPPPAPEPPAAPDPLVVFGGTGTGEGRFDRPRHLALDREGQVYVADRTNRIQVFDARGAHVRTFVAETDRRPANELTTDVTYVLGLAVDSRGKVHVALGYDLLRFDGATGREEHRVRGRFGSACYRDVSVDQRDRLYVRSACTDTDRYALLRLASSGRVEARVAEPNVYEEAATGRVAVDGAGRWYVPYGYEYDVRVLEPDGRLHTRIGRRGEGPGEFDVSAVGPLALDPEGRLYVRNDDRLDVFAPDGRYLGAVDPSAAGGHPLDVAIAADGHVWVLTNEDRVARFAPFEAPADAPR